MIQLIPNSHDFILPLNKANLHILRKINRFSDLSKSVQEYEKCKAKFQEIGEDLRSRCWIIQNIVYPIFKAIEYLVLIWKTHFISPSIVERAQLISSALKQMARDGFEVVLNNKVMKSGRELYNTLKEQGFSESTIYSILYQSQQGVFAAFSTPDQGCLEWLNARFPLREAEGEVLSDLQQGNKCPYLSFSRDKYVDEWGFEKIDTRDEPQKKITINITTKQSDKTFVISSETEAEVMVYVESARADRASRSIFKYNTAFQIDPPKCGSNIRLKNSILSMTRLLNMPQLIDPGRLLL